MSIKGAGEEVMSAGNAVSGNRFRALVLSIVALGCVLFALPAAASAAAPVANDVFAGTNDVTPVTVNFNATNAPDTYNIVTPPSGGSLGPVSNTPPGSVDYTANGAFAGIDSFSYSATNVDGTSNTANVTVIVRPDTAIDSGPSGLTNDNTPTFLFSSPQAGTVFECRVDADAFAPCAGSFTAATLSDGAHTFDVRARAGLGGPLDNSPASASFNVDATAPTPNLQQGAAQDDPTNASPIVFEIVTNEDLKPASVTSDDFDVTNGSIDSITGTGQSLNAFEINVTPSADGDVTVDPSATYEVEDLAGNATSFAGNADRTVTYDTTAPTVTLEQANGQADPTNAASIEFTLSADEDLANASIDNSDFDVSNGSIDSITGSGDSRTITVTAAADGAVVIAPSGTFGVEDLSGNNQATALGADRSVTYDTVAPTVDIDKASGQADPTTSTAIEFTLSSDEDLASGTVTTADFDATNATIDSVTGSGDEYTIAVTASAEGDVDLDASGAFSVDDVAGNSQTTATTSDNSVLYDTAPDLTLEQAAGQADPTNVAAVEFTLSADEPLNPATVEASDFDITNGSVDSVTGAGSTYTVAVTAAGDGDVVIAPSGTFSVEDILGNPETNIVGGTDRTVHYDGTAPVSDIDSSPADPSYDRTPSFEFSADEPVTGFECSLVASGDPSDFQPCTSPLDPAELAPGDYSFKVRSTDLAGNTGAGTGHDWTILPSSITGSPVQATYFTRGGNPVTVAVFATDAQAGALSFSQDAGGSGTLSGFSATPNGATAEYVSADGFAGVDTVTLRVRNDATQAYRDISIDVAVRPATVLLSGPGVNGANPNSNSASPTFTFDAVSGPHDVSVAGVSYACSIDGAPQPSLDCASGSWTPAAPLAEGPHTFSVTASKPALNVDPQTQTVNFSVDTVDPDAPVLTGTEGLTNSNDLSYTVTLPEGTAECRLIGPGDPSPAWMDDDCDGDVDYAAVPDGAYTFEVRTVDSAGNRSTVSSLSATVDTTITVTIDSAPADGNADARPTFEFSSPEDPDITYTCRMFGLGVGDATFEACSSPVVSAFLDTNERFRFEVKGVDQAGNETTTWVEWDQANNAPAVPAPDVTVEAGEDVVVSLGSTDADSDPLTYSITSEEITGGTLDAIDQPSGDVTFSAYGASAGVYTFDFEVTDQREGGTVPGTATVNVQPQTVIVTEPPAETNNVRPTWTFESPSGVTEFECKLDTEAWERCDTGSYTPAVDLTEGLHGLAVRALSGTLADPTPAASLITVDLTAPDVAIDATPVALSNVTNPVFEFSSTDPTATFECSFDGGDWAACISGDPTAEALEDGMRNFRVRAVDPGTNAGTPASYDWELDATEPAISLGGTPPEVSNGPGEGKQTKAKRPVWYFERSDINLDSALVRCRVDAQAWLETCLSPFQPLANLNDGQHTLQIQAEDTAGNLGELTVNFKVNTLAASVAITDAPNSPSGSNVTFQFSPSVDLGPEGSFACRTNLNGGAFGAWAPCVSPLELTGLSSGTRTLQVKAIDSAGNESTGAGIASYTWTTVGDAPETAIIGSNKSGTTAAFAFNSPGNPLATFECSLDGAPFTACSSPKSYTGLSAAAHEFAVRAVNAVGTRDASPATDSWTASASTAPDTNITRRPPARTTDTAASFEFASTDSVATFECRLDGGAWEACDSPKAYTDLALADHTFEVRSSSVGGLTDQSPASVTWTVSDTLVDPTPATLRKPVVRAPKQIRSGKAVALRVYLRNTGETATDARVCVAVPKRLVRGKGFRQCRVITVDGSSPASTAFRFGTKPRQARKRLNIRTVVVYTSAGETKRVSGGHITVLK